MCLATPLHNLRLGQQGLDVFPFLLAHAGKGPICWLHGNELTTVIERFSLQFSWQTLPLAPRLRSLENTANGNRVSNADKGCGKEYHHGHGGGWCGIARIVHV
jgi:hypothetical protein